jgi:hypothetical protein
MQIPWHAGRPSGCHIPGERPPIRIAGLPSTGESAPGAFGGDSINAHNRECAVCESCESPLDIVSPNDRARKSLPDGRMGGERTRVVGGHASSQADH